MLVMMIIVIVVHCDDDGIGGSAGDGVHSFNEDIGDDGVLKLGF